MNPPQFLCDHDFHQQIFEGLLRAEPLIELTTLRSLELERLSDDEVLTYAAEHGLLVLSHDRNTMTAAAGKRIAARQPMLGMFIIKQTESIRVAIEQVLMIWAASHAQEWNHRIVFLPI